MIKDTLKLENLFTAFLSQIGENIGRQGLQETPARMAKAWKFWVSGYDQTPGDIFKTFEDGGEGYDQMIIVDPISFFSHCEHHVAPFFGDIHIGYIPTERIAGLSKFIRLANCYSRRLQVQERLTVQIANAIELYLKPQGVAVFIKARHFCMESRGVEKTGSFTKTSAMRGVFFDNPSTRSEFFDLLKL